jgi:hypothetical protein
MAFLSTYVRNKATGKTAAGGDIVTLYTVPGGKTFIVRGLMLLGEVEVTTAGAGTDYLWLSPYVLPSGGTDATANANNLGWDISGGATVVPLIESQADISFENGGTAFNSTGQPHSLQAMMVVCTNTSQIGTSQLVRIGLTSATVLNAGDAIKTKRSWDTSNASTWSVLVAAWIWGDEYTP